jgi:hypothetical protein
MKYTARETYEKALQKLNKLVSNAEQDLPEYIWVYTFNEAYAHWIEQNFKEAERNNDKVHKLQHLIVPHQSISLQVNQPGYDIFILPLDYLKYISCESYVGDCDIPLECHFWELHNIPNILKDSMWSPNLEYRETLCAIANNSLLVYNDRTFKNKQVNLSYYRQGNKIDIADGFTHYDGTSTADIDPEITDDNLEEVLDLAVQIIAGNISDSTKWQDQLQHIKQTQYNR